VKLELRRGIGVAADVPAGLRQRGARIVGQRRGGPVVRAVIREPHAIDPAYQTAGLQQRGGAQGIDAGEEARTEPQPAGQLVRLRLDRAADFKSGAADGDAIADLEVEPRQQGRIGGGAEHTVALGQQIAQRQFRRQRQRAEHWIGVIDRLEFDQRKLAVRRPRHGAQRRRHRHRSALAQEGDFVRLRLALDQ
jgi:hypothetical protein